MDVINSEKIDYAISERPFDVLNGDAAFIDTTQNNIFIGIIDGAGHGPEAYSIAQLSQKFLKQNQNTKLPILMEKLHKELKGTRGGVAAIGILDLEKMQFNYVAVGNLHLRVFGNNQRQIVTQPGVLGYGIRRLLEKTLTFSPGDVFVLHTDGIKTRFSLKDYPELLAHSAKTISKTLINRFRVTNDDATCIVIRFI
jgi:negative regulator of sigma-B (phosphoserine phosphatase)